MPARLSCRYPEGRREQQGVTRLVSSFIVCLLLVLGGQLPQVVILLAHTLLPSLPDRSNQIAFQRPNGLPPGFAFRLAPCQIPLGSGGAARLGQCHAVQDRIQPPIATAVEPMPHPFRGRGFHRGDAGEGRQLRLPREALPWPQNPRQRSRANSPIPESSASGA